MTQNQIVFQQNKKIFLEQVIPASSKSPIYLGMENELDSLLLLADRILAASQEDLEFGRVKYIKDHLLELNSGEKQSRVAENILEDIELWLRVILSFANPNLSQIRRTDTKYSLAHLIREDLDLLSQEEISLDVDHDYQINDSVNQLIFLAYRYRNPLTHSPRDYPDSIKARFFPASLCALIAPIYKYKKQIKEVLSGLIVSRFDTPAHVNILSLVNSERLKHIANFQGRERWLRELTQKLLEPSHLSKPYILLNGFEGMGKSALVAKITEELSIDKQIVGRNAGLVRKTAPWLPDLIVHFGKQSNQISEIIDLLLAQINTLLLEPIELEQVRTSLKDFLDKSVIQFGRSPMEYQDHYVVEKPYLNLSALEEVDFHKIESYDFTLYRRALSLALERVVKEKGSVILVIDAVDEISLDGSNLCFLPDPLPIGVSALLSARENKVVKWLENNRSVDVIRLKELEKSEIPLFTNIRNEDGEQQSKFNERVWKASGGWPLMVLEASKLARNSPNDLDSIQIDRTKDSLFERRVQEWRAIKIDNSPEAPIDILKLLSIFEPVVPLDLDMIQAFLERNNSEFSRNEIKLILQIVSSQVDGIDANRVKLALKAFAEFVRERWMGKRDLLRALDDIVEWLAKKEYDDPRIFSQFLEYWTSSAHTKDVRKSAEKLVDHFILSHDADVLYKIFRGLQYNNKNTPILSEITIRCLRSSSDLGNISAMAILGGRLLDGEGFDRNVDEGKDLLERAAASNDPEVMIVLANRLLDGKGLGQDAEKGRQILVKAVELENQRAKHIYAIRLLEGSGFDQDVHQGEYLLRELSNQGYEQASYDLANRLIEGDVIEKDEKAGEEILRKLCDKSDFAEFLLANRLIDGDGLSANIAEGESILRKLASKGNRNAIFVLANRLHYGKGLPKNIDESLSLLDKLSSSGDLDAMRILGTLLISGDEIPCDVEAGKRWLTKAAEADDVESMIFLSENLLDGNFMPKSQQEGRRWLLKAAETKNPKAMQILAVRLLNGYGILKDQSEGLKWLKKAVDANDPRSVSILGSKLIYGEGLEKDLVKGERLLRQGVENNDTEAMRSLGVGLIDGDVLVENLEEGERLLRQSAEEGNETAMMQLGMRLFEGEKLNN